jgi:hypothetical protein
VLAVLAPLASLSARCDEAPAMRWELDAALGRRTLSEHDESGARLLRESGPIVRLRASAQPLAPRWEQFDLNAAIAQAVLDYGGQSQSGVPLATTTRHSELDLGVGWHPLPAASWGQPVLSFSWLGTRRSIASTSTTSSLVESSSLWMPGLAWRSPEIETPYARLSALVRWRASVFHRMYVDYAGVFDDSSLNGGQRNEGTLRLVAARPDGWRWAIEWVHMRQDASAPVPLLRGGAPAGSVHQPRLGIDDVTLSVGREF